MNFKSIMKCADVTIVINIYIAKITVLLIRLYIYNIFYVVIAWMDHVKHCSQFRIYIGFVWQSVTILWAHFHFQLVFQFKLNLSKVQTRMKAWNDELSVLLNEYCVESI